MRCGWFERFHWESWARCKFSRKEKVLTVFWHKPRLKTCRKTCKRLVNDFCFERVVWWLSFWCSTPWILELGTPVWSWAFGQNRSVIWSIQTIPRMVQADTPMPIIREAADSARRAAYLRQQKSHPILPKTPYPARLRYSSYFDVISVWELMQIFLTLQLRVDNLTRSFADGRVLCALLAKFLPQFDWTVTPSDDNANWTDHKKHLDLIESEYGALTIQMGFQMQWLTFLWNCGYHSGIAAPCSVASWPPAKDELCLYLEIFIAKVSGDRQLLSSAVAGSVSAKQAPKRKMMDSSSKMRQSKTIQKRSEALIRQLSQGNGKQVSDCVFAINGFLWPLTAISRLDGQWKRRKWWSSDAWSFAGTW